MKLYGYWRSGAAWRVRIALNLKGVAPELRTVHLLREGGEPGRPNVRRRTQTLAFAPGQIAGQYRGTESGDPLNGGRMVWARLAGQTLTIYSLEFGEGGRYEMETYARTLVGTGMDLNYSRVSEGERVRGVKGRLVKQAN